MKIIETIKAMIAYRKLFKTFKMVRFGDTEMYNAYSFASCYRAQESVCNYYLSFYPNDTFEDAMELIRYSEALREAIKRVISERIITVKPDEFDFTADPDGVRFFREFGDQERNLTIAQLFPMEAGIGYMDALSVKVEQAYYIYLKKQKGYTKEWKEFINDLMNDKPFCEPAHTAMKYWLANLTFPSEEWANKKVIGLMNEAKQRIQIYGRQG